MFRHFPIELRGRARPHCAATATGTSLIEGAETETTEGEVRPDEAKTANNGPIGAPRLDEGRPEAEKLIRFPGQRRLAYCRTEPRGTGKCGIRC